MTPEECLIIYGQAWFEPDHAQRVEVLRRCCTEDVVFMDSQLGRLHGLDEVSKMIGGYIGQRPSDAVKGKSEPNATGRTESGVGVQVVTKIDVLHRFFRYSFVWSMPDGSKSGGTDFGEFAEDGRMSLITVWPSSADFPVRGAD